MLMDLCANRNHATVPSTLLLPPEGAFLNQPNRSKKTKVADCREGSEQEQYVTSETNV